MERPATRARFEWLVLPFMLTDPSRVPERVGVLEEQIKIADGLLVGERRPRVNVGERAGKLLLPTGARAGHSEAGEPGAAGCRRAQRKQQELSSMECAHPATRWKFSVTSAGQSESPMRTDSLMSRVPSSMDRTEPV